MSWPFQGRKTNDHALIKGCGKLDASASPQLPAPFLRFFTPAHRDSRAVLPAAGHGGQRTPNISQIDTLSALRFAGVPGTTTSRDRVVGASSTSLASGFAKSSLIPLLLLSPQSHSTLRGPHYCPTPCALASCQSGGAGQRIPISAGGITGHTRPTPQPSSAAVSTASSGQVPYPSLPTLPKARSFHCPSSPNRTRCAGLRFGLGARQGKPNV